MSEQNPITPVNQRRDSATIIRASVDSWCSNDSGNSSMSVEYEWTPAQIQLLCTVRVVASSHNPNFILHRSLTLLASHSDRD